MATPVSGLTAVTNPEATRGGADIESDELLLERFFHRYVIRGQVETRRNI